MSATQTKTDGTRSPVRAPNQFIWKGIDPLAFADAPPMSAIQDEQTGEAVGMAFADDEREFHHELCGCFICHPDGHTPDCGCVRCSDTQDIPAFFTRGHDVDCQCFWCDHIRRREALNG